MHAQWVRRGSYTVKPLFTLTLALGVSPTALLAQAQATTGIIRGTVVDPTGVAVPAAQVTVRHQETGLERTLEATGRGIFVASLLPVGTYDVSARSVSFVSAAERRDVPLRLGETVELRLQFPAIEVEELVVTAEGVPLVDATDVTQSQRLSTEVVEGLPNNGRNFLDFTLLTPGVAIVQGPDGDELTISGQRGIFNNIIVDGADFNNPFFGEQRGGQRPAFTFNLDAIEEILVVNQGATAEFGRSAGGFVNVLTKSGTNEFEGTVHYFGQFDEISADFARGGGNPDFSQNQFGLTLGGPLVRDKAFFFIAYDQQEFTQTKQTNRASGVANPAELQKLESFLQTAFGGALANDFGPVERTDDNKALLVKFDWRPHPNHSFSLKYNFTDSEQINGTFDVDAWGLSANGIETDESHAVNGALSSQISPTVANEFRFQWAREDRLRPYEGPVLTGGTSSPPSLARLNPDRPFPDIAMDFVDGFRLGLPFFLPIDPAFDTRIQILDNVSVLAGDHLFKIGGEWNRTTIDQQFIGFANALFKFSSVDGFINYVEQGNSYVECSDGSANSTGSCPAGTTITGPVLLYLQSATVPPTPAANLGLQSFAQHEVAFFVQDSWKPMDNLTLNLGVRWEGLIQPGTIIPPEETFYAPFLGTSKAGQGGQGPFEFPSDGEIPDDLNNFQPRFGLAWDIKGDGSQVFRANAGSYFSRIPALVLAQHRTTNGAFQQILFRSSAASPFLGAPPAIDSLLETSGALPFLPTIQVPDVDMELARTWSFSGEFEQKIGDYVAATLAYQYARTDNLFRFVDRNDPVFGSPWGTGLPLDFRNPGGPADTINGIGQLIVTESTARSNYHGITFGLKGRNALEGRLEFELNYTLSFDRSDDDNERDPFTFRFARADRLEEEFNWSDRDQRHRFNAYVLARLPGDVMWNNLIRAATAQPISESCGPTASNPFAPPAGERAAAPVDRICADGTILKRNTLRKDNGLFTWDIRLSRVFPIGQRLGFEPIFEVFNVFNTDNFLDTAPTSLLFNFDGTIRSGLGDPRRVQLAARVIF